MTWRYATTTYPHANGSWSGYVLREPDGATAFTPPVHAKVDVVDIRAGFMNEQGAINWATRRAEEIAKQRKGTT